MSTRKKRILFARIVIGPTHYDNYAIVCPACGVKSDISGDIKHEAEHYGKMTMPCCGKIESVYDDET